MKGSAWPPASPAGGGDGGGGNARLRRLLGSPETAWIVERVRKRLERGQPLAGTITLSDASEAQRVAAGRVLGRRVSAGRSVSVSLERIEEVLVESGAWGAGLASAVVALTGPVDDPFRRQAERAAWEAVAVQLDQLAERHPHLTAWVAGVQATGRVRRLTAGADEALSVVHDLHKVVDAWPADGEPLAGFAGRVLGKAHGLDADTALGALAASAAHALASPPPARERIAGDAGNAASGPKPDVSGRLARRPGTAAGRRDAFATVGIVVDDLSSTVLTLGLPGGSSSATAVALARLTMAGQPAVLTLRQLVEDDPGLTPPLVNVCENPSVVSSAAERIGAQSSPLVCLAGQPGAAAVALLRTLCRNGARLRYHGDFDWGGVTIARTLASHVDWEPWRFTSIDYRHAIADRHTPHALPPLHGVPQLTPWDPDLATTMDQHGVGVEEELVVESLLTDLDASDASTWQRASMHRR